MPILNRPFHLPWSPPLASKGGTGGGNRNSGAPFPRLSNRSRRAVACALAPMAEVRNRHVLDSLQVRRPLPLRRSVPPVSSRRRCRSRAERSVGRERPPFGCPLLRPTPGAQGSLTPHMHVAVIRRDGAMPVTPPNAAPVSSAVRTSFALTARARLSGSSGKLRSYR